MRKRTRAKCSSARPASARAPICHACFEYGDGRQCHSCTVSRRRAGATGLIGGRIDYMCSTIQTGAAPAKQERQGHRGDVAAPRQDHSDLATTGEQGVPDVEASGLERVLPAAGRPQGRSSQAQQSDDARSTIPSSANGWKSRPRYRGAAAAFAGLSRQVLARRRGALGQGGARRRHRPELRPCRKICAETARRFEFRSAWSDDGPRAGFWASSPAAPVPIAGCNRCRRG